MDKIRLATAREFYDNYESDDAVIMMKAFAELHVKAALEAAARIKIAGLLQVHIFPSYQQKEILNAYPLTNIK